MARGADPVLDVRRWQSAGASNIVENVFASGSSFGKVWLDIEDNPSAGCSWKAAPAAQQSNKRSASGSSPNKRMRSSGEEPIDAMARMQTRSAAAGPLGSKGNSIKRGDFVRIVLPQVTPLLAKPKERFVKVTRTEGLGDLEGLRQEKEDDLRRREEALLAREQALADHPDAGGPSQKAAPAWHAALLDGLQTIQQNLLL